MNTFPYLPSRPTKFSDRMTRTEDFIPIWTYKRKERGVGALLVVVVVAIISGAACAKYFFGA